MLNANYDPVEIRDLYRPTVAFGSPDDWRKFLPTDKPSAWWYDTAALEKLIFAYIAKSRTGERDQTLRDFVRNFRGLTQTAKAKEVCDHFPDIPRLSAFEACPGRIRDLLSVMRQTAAAPSPDVLGTIGKEHFRTRFAEWFGIKRSGEQERFWYQRERGLVAGVPFSVEVALAETESETLTDRFLTGVNFSPTFEDPLAGTRLQTPKLTAHGIASFLRQAHVLPDLWGSRTARTVAALHLTCPALEFLDRGKTRLRVPGEIADKIAAALWSVSKTLYEEEERRQRDAARAERSERNREQQQQDRDLGLKAAVYAVVPEAMAHASGDGQYPVSTRFLYYAVRERIQRHTRRELDYNYQYQRDRGALEGLYYDPRGVLYEPHTGKAVPLGTREVEAYTSPSWLYNKILYIEKKGVWPVFQAAQLAERYDMAIVAAEGYASEAARVLFAHADKQQQYQLFVLHDADPHGYNIARTLQEATDRMPGYQVEVLDLGLKLEDALGRGLQTEEFTRKKAIPKKLDLTPVEWEYFTGRRMTEKSWLCQRIEINALSAPDLVTYVEEQLQAHGVRPKVVPPETVIHSEARSQAEAILQTWITDIIREEVDLDALVDNIFDAATHVPDVKAEEVKERLVRYPELRWSTIVDTDVYLHLSSHRDGLRDRVIEALRQRLSAE